MSKVGFLTKVINFIAENSTTLLTVGAVTGVVASSVTSWYAAKKTKDIKERLGSDSSFGDVAKESWPYYVAPVIIGGLTIASIITLNIEHDKKYAALLGAYTIAKTDKEKLGNKVKELVGEENTKKIEESLGVKDENPVEETKLVVGSNELPGDPYKKEWIVDGETGMRIYTSKVAIVNATNMVNQMVAENIDEGQTVEDFYNYLGVTELEMPNIAQSMSFKVGERIGSMHIEWCGITDKDYNTMPVFNYDYNLDRDADVVCNRRDW